MGRWQMEKTLRTLKDLEAENSNKKPEETMWICSVRLKQEAIKWIKVLEDNARKLLKKKDTFNAKGNAMSANMFREFFNIMEEAKLEELK